MSETFALPVCPLCEEFEHADGPVMVTVERDHGIIPVVDLHGCEDETLHICDSWQDGRWILHLPMNRDDMKVGRQTEFYLGAEIGMLLEHGLRVHIVSEGPCLRPEK